MNLVFSVNLPISFLGFFGYLALTAIFTGFFISLGSVIYSKILQSAIPSIRYSVYGLSGMVIYAFLCNIISYILAPPTGLIVACLVSFVPLVIRLYHILKNKQYKIFKIYAEPKLFWMSLLIIFIILFLGIFQRNNFDEELHRPLINTILNGNFPIRSPFNPFYFLQYNYHYGWALVSASFSALFKLDIPVSLDIIKLCCLVLGYTFIWGIIPSTKPLIKAVVVYSVLLTGPFWFFGDSFTSQYLMGSKEEMVGFSYIHSLQAISFISVITFFSSLYLIFQVIQIKVWKFTSFVFNLIALSILFSGIALTGEFQLAALIAIFAICLIIKIYTYLFQNNRGGGLSYFILSIAFSLSLIISIFQGGVLTGVIFPGKLEAPQPISGTPSNIDADIPSGTISNLDWLGSVQVKSKPIFGIRNIKNFGFAPIDNYYIKLSEPAKYAPSIGLIGLIGFPIMLAYLLYLIYKMIRSKTTGQYPFYLGLTAITFLVIPIIGTTRYGDMNIARGWISAIMICYGLISYLIYTHKASNSWARVSRTVYTIVLVLAWAPAIAFNLGVFIFKPVFGNPSPSYILDGYSTQNANLSTQFQVEKKLFDAIKINNYNHWTVAVTEDSQYLTEQTGNLTYRDLLAVQPEFYKHLVSTLDPKDFARIGAEYLYYSPNLNKKLNEEGTRNLNQYFEPIFIETSNGVVEGIYKLKSNH